MAAMGAKTAFGVVAAQGRACRPGEDSIGDKTCLTTSVARAHRSARGGG